MDFNSLPHTEVDLLRQPFLFPHTNFNSLPHTEVDALGGGMPQGNGPISTHYLTQR